MTVVRIVVTAAVVDMGYYCSIYSEPRTLLSSFNILTCVEYSKQLMNKVPLFLSGVYRDRETETLPLVTQIINGRVRI